MQTGTLVREWSGHQSYFHNWVPVRWALRREGGRMSGDVVAMILNLLTTGYSRTRSAQFSRGATTG